MVSSETNLDIQKYIEGPNFYSEQNIKEINNDGDFYSRKELNKLQQNPIYKERHKNHDKSANNQSNDDEFSINQIYTSSFKQLNKLEKGNQQGNNNLEENSNTQIEITSEHNNYSKAEKYLNQKRDNQEYETDKSSQFQEHLDSESVGNFQEKKKLPIKINEVIQDEEAQTKRNITQGEHIHNRINEVEMDKNSLSFSENLQDEQIQKQICVFEKVYQPSNIKIKDQSVQKENKCNLLSAQKQDQSRQMQIQNLSLQNSITHMSKSSKPNSELQQSFQSCEDSHTVEQEEYEVEEEQKQQNPNPDIYDLEDIFPKIRIFLEQQSNQMKQSEEANYRKKKAKKQFLKRFLDVVQPKKKKQLHNYNKKIQDDLSSSNSYITSSLFLDSNKNHHHHHHHHYKKPKQYISVKRVQSCPNFNYGNGAQKCNVIQVNESKRNDQSLEGEQNVTEKIVAIDSDESIIIAKKQKYKQISSNNVQNKKIYEKENIQKQQSDFQVLEITNNQHPSLQQLPDQQGDKEADNFNMNNSFYSVVQGKLQELQFRKKWIKKKLAEMGFIQNQQYNTEEQKQENPIALIVFNQLSDKEIMENELQLVLMKIINKSLKKQQYMIKNRQIQNPDYNSLNVRVQVQKVICNNDNHSESNNSISFGIPVSVNQIEVIQENKNINFEIDDQQSIYEDKEVCEICCSSVDAEDLKGVSSCKHRFCEQCIKAHLEQLIKTSNVIKVLCPELSCQNTYKDEEVRKFVGEAMYKKFLRFREIKILSQDPDVRWCCRQGCEKYAKRQNKNQKKVVCECGQEICFECRSMWHYPVSCLEAMDEDYAKAVKLYTIQKCPNCKSPIQKMSGCNQMTCKQCNYSFCWLCRRKYTSIHFNKYNILGCPGKQFSTNNPQKSNKLKYIACFLPQLILGLIVLAVGLAVLPLILVVIGIGAPLCLYDQKYKLNRKPLCKKIIICTLLILLGIIFLPIIVLLEIIPGSCIYLKKEYNSYVQNN